MKLEDVGFVAMSGAETAPAVAVPPPPTSTTSSPPQAVPVPKKQSRPHPIFNTDTLILGSIVGGGVLVASSEKGSTRRKLGWALAVGPIATLVGGVFFIMAGGPVMIQKAFQSIKG